MNMDSQALINTLPCHICNGTVDLISNFEQLQQITSDCQPWQAGGQLAICSNCKTVQKQITPKWLKQIETIYSQYKIYSQGDGEEQPIFNLWDGTSNARSDVISAWLNSRVDFNYLGKLLDVGCGTGVFLKAFSKTNPSWKLYGFEHNDKNKAAVESIPNVISLFSGSIEKITQPFDVVSLIHSLEHIQNPLKLLNYLANILKPNGYLLIEVPNLESSPFDILIADHCSHFSLCTLEYCLNVSGFKIVFSEKDLAPKELTVLAQVDKNLKFNANKYEQKQDKSLKLVETQLEWLNKLLEQAKALTDNVGIFGTSISATWLRSSLEDKVKFFVDEDRNRVGKTHLNLPIIGVDDIPIDSSIVMPLRIDIARSIKNRLGLSNLILPPEFNEY